MKRPNVLFVFADQWRAQATGYAGDPNVRTPHLDDLCDQAVNFTCAVSGNPVCSPYRASLLTGQYPLSHRVIVNDVPLDPQATTIAKVFARGGYQTGYIGKWHVDGHGRGSFIPPARRQGFEFWRVMECTHDYNASDYYADTDELLRWDGYDAAAQTRCAADYIRHCDRSKPFMLMLSWGPPHNPYETAPARFRAMYDPQSLTLRPNVREGMPWGPNTKGTIEKVRKDLAGYYAHCSALDDCIGQLRSALRETGLEDDTILVFTSDHGDMLGSQGRWRKQVPYDESIRVPLLVSWPAGLGRSGSELPCLIDGPDIMPTLLGLCGLELPLSVEGRDFWPVIIGQAGPQADDAALLSCMVPLIEWRRSVGGREYRGLRTERHTYVRDLEGPWLLFDNVSDPFQMENLAGRAEHAELQRRLDVRLERELRRLNDPFETAHECLRRFGYMEHPSVKWSDPAEAPPAR